MRVPKFAKRDIIRAEGRQNYGYGVQPGASRSVLTLHREIAKKRAAEAVRYTSPTPQPVNPADFSALTRDGLRALAKAKGLTGYGKMNKAELIEAVSA